VTAPKGRQNFAPAFAVQLMEHLVVPTFVLDDQRRVIIWNRACERLTGVPAADVLGTRDQWRGFYEAPRYCLADILVLGRAYAAKRGGRNRVVTTGVVPGS
jgi:PAS domain-containing protein